MCLWEQMGQPKKGVNPIELGSDRGTLMVDPLRGTSKFKAFTRSPHTHLVGCSPTLQRLQYKILKCGDESDTTNDHTGSSIISLGGASILWHATLDQVPSSLPTIIIAHEFYDVLPVHQLQKASCGWCEKMINVLEDPTLHFVLCPHPTLQVGWSRGNRQA